MKKLLLIQPRLMSYRVELANDLADRAELILAFSQAPSDDGAWEPDTLAHNVRTRIVPTHAWLGGAIYYQADLIGIVRRERPDAIVCFANPRYLSFWALALVAQVLRIPFYAHGQGLFRRPNPGKLRRIMFRAMLARCTGYLAYNAFAARSLQGLSTRDNVAALENFFVNPCATPSHERDYEQNGVLFIGRLRPGCELERLADAIIAYNLAPTHGPLRVKVIGGGQLLSHYRNRYRAHPEIELLGEIYACAEIRDVSLTCFAGCYPGMAGLSIVHMMSMSLPAIVNERLELHMGPEPAYVVDGETGFHFSQTDPARSLERVIARLAGSRQTVAAVGANAYRFYQALSRVRLADRMLEAMRW